MREGKHLEFYTPTAAHMQLRSPRDSLVNNIQL